MSRKESAPDDFHIVFPVVAVDAPVFACSLAEHSNAIDLNPITAGIPLRWARPLGGRELTILDVVVADGLSEYVTQSRAYIRELYDELRWKR
jgi:hypothetical protein